jgi:hypothetical protein
MLCLHRRLPVPLILLLSIAAISGLARPARAQSAEAEGMFSEGDRLMAAGQIAQACDAFEASNRIEQRAGTLIRLGECREKNHQIASAWSAYKDALTRVRDPRKRDIAQAKATELEAKLSFLTISVPDESRVDGLAIMRNGKPVEPLLWNRAVPVDGGSYVIAGRAPGHEAWQITVEVAAEHGSRSVEVPKFKELAKLIAPPSTNGAGASGDGDEDDDHDARRSPSRFTPRRKLALGLAGGAVLGIAAGAVLGVMSTGKQHDADALCPDPAQPCADAERAQSLNQSASHLALDADIAFGAGAVLAITAGVLWFTGAPELHGVALAPTHNGITLVGRF